MKDKLPTGLNFKKSNIRIWIHQRNLTNLQQVVWEGYGSKLLVEHSNNPKIKKFLEAVPHIMGLIKEIHTDVHNGDLDSLKNHLNPPIPPMVLSGKDINGLTALHKAVGLGKTEIAEYIVNEYPNSVNIPDNEGRTPLHYAALLRDDGNMTNFLIEHGADESVLDSKQKTAAYYKTRHSELDTKLLTVVPECPRSAKESFAANFDWSMLTSSLVTNGIHNIAKKSEHFNGNSTDNTPSEEIKEKSDLNGNGSEKASESENQSEQENGSENRDSKEDVSDIKEEESTKEEEIVEDDEKKVDTAKEEEPNEESKVEEKNEEENNNKEENKEDSTQQDDEATNVEDTKEEIGDKVDDTNENNEERPSSSKNIELNNNNEAIEEKNEELNESKNEENNENNDSNDINIENQNGKEEISLQPISRPTSSSINSNTRPNSQAAQNKTRPNSQNNELSRPSSRVNSNTRPNSRVESNTRPNSRINEITENHIEKPGTPYPTDSVVEEEGVIEGIVDGEHEVETLNDEGQKQRNSSESDEDLKALVDAGNMEQLAAIVLNGEGDRLVGQTTDNPELQSFLENVPVYMSKINRIHEAARNGSLRDLQAALDRRKFAIAKDPISPKGASPLHVAVVFGNTSIVRYLAGRFPETVQVVDEDGRTPLHYAAVLGDNGHYYNLLVHLGADARTQDKFGNTPEYYRKNQQDFSHRSLLKEFGAEENLVEEILTDKENVTQENGQVDMPFFATEEGRYLASSLGDPLIKGLTEVANKRPEDPIAYLAQYLYNFANTRSNLKSRGRTQENHQVITGSPIPVDDNNAVPANIDVVTVEPDESNSEEESAFNTTSRDEHGQSMLHFAAARAHGRNALFQLLLETEINVAFRDELYRTARDISIQANIPENTEEIDRYVLHIATKGDTDKLVELLLDGYDHITDIVDDEDVPIIEAVSKANQTDTVSFLQSILAFEEKRERVHHAIRQGSINDVTTLLADENDTGSGKLLAIGKNSYGRSTLHIAVLCQQEEIVDYLANTFPDTLKLGDNLERTALHYAMGVDKMEMISRVLIKAGARRIAKDLKGRQPTYYFLNKSEILRLQEEEETF